MSRRQISLVSIYPMFLVALSACNTPKRSSHQLSNGGSIQYKIDSTYLGEMDSIRIPDYQPPRAIITTSLKIKHKGSQFKVKNTRSFWHNGGISYGTKIDTLKFTPLEIDSSLIEGKFALKIPTVNRTNDTSTEPPTRNATSIAVTAPAYIYNSRKYSYSYEFNLYGECKIHEYHPGSCTPGTTRTTIGVYEIKKDRIILYEFYSKWKSINIEPTVFYFSSSTDTLTLKQDSSTYVIYNSEPIPKFAFE